MSHTAGTNRAASPFGATETSTPICLSCMTETTNQQLFDKLLGELRMQPA
jgi:hypothetical protein